MRLIQWDTQGKAPSAIALKWCINTSPIQGPVTFAITINPACCINLHHAQINQLRVTKTNVCQQVDWQRNVEVRACDAKLLYVLTQADQRALNTSQCGGGELCDVAADACDQALGASLLFLHAPPKQGKQRAVQRDQDTPTQ
jgi:hypothetical protein